MRRSLLMTQLAWCIALAVFLLRPLAAQEAETPAGELEAPPPTGPIPIPQADIPAESDDLSDNLRRLEALLKQGSDIVSIEEPTDRLMSLRTRLQSLDVGFLSPARLEDQRIEWLSLQSEFDSLQEQLSERWAALERARAELAVARRQWEVTLETAASEEAPPEILLRLTSNLEAIDATNAQVSERRDEVASLLQQVTGERDVVQEGVAQIDGIAESIRRRLLTRDAPPIWEPPAVSSASLQKDAMEGARYWVESLISSFSKNPEFVYAWTLLLLLLLGITLALNRWKNSWPAEDRDLDPARFVVSRPISTALALALASAALFLRSAATSVHDLISVLALVPVLRLGTGLLDRRALPALYGSLGFFTLNVLWWLAPDGSMLRRLGLLFATAAAIAGVTYLLAMWRRQPDTNSVGWRAARVGLRVAGLVLSASLIANLLGWFTLSQTLTDATGESVYSAVAWLVVVLVSRSILVLIPRSFLANLFISIRRNDAAFLRLTTIALALLAGVIWTRGVLGRFQMLDRLTEGVKTMLSASIAVGGLEVSAGSILASLSLILLTWLGARFGRFVLSEEILPRLHLPVGAKHSVITLSNYIFWGVGLALAAAAAGLSGTQLTVVVGALGVGIGFGLQNIIGNFVSGLILIFERPIRVGDRVQTAQYMGIVTGIGIRACTIRTYDGAEVVVPNGDLIAKEFINWTHTDETRRVELNVRVAYGTDPKKVLAILARIASEHPKVLESPPPSAFMIGFGESALDFRLWAWGRIPDFLTITSDLHVTVSEELAKEGIEIPLPQRDVNVRAVDPERSPDAAKALSLSERSTRT